jgi:hypothetical protein
LILVVAKDGAARMNEIRQVADRNSFFLMFLSSLKFGIFTPPPQRPPRPEHQKADIAGRAAGE